MKTLTTSLFLIGSIALFSGCQQNLDKPLQPKIDKNLPMVQTNSIRSISGIDFIALEWKGIDSQEALGYNIYRSDMQKDSKKFKRIASLKNKYITHYLDKGLEANNKYSYSISLISKDNVESTPSESTILSTLPNFKSISLLDTRSNLPRQIKILWRPHEDASVSGYIIERNTPTASKWEKLVELKDRYNIEYIDTGLGDNETYSYRIKAIKFNGIVSNPSDVSRATTKSLPSQISTLKATNNLPRKIQISWGESQTEDVVRYNIYSSVRVDGSFQKIAQAPIGHNRFDNNIAQDGATFFYKITTVDKDGLESNIDDVKAVMGSTLSKPKMPKITLAQIQDNKIILNWEDSDKRAIKYNIYKSVNNSWADKELKVIKNLTGLRFEDKDVLRGVEYRYSIQAIDKYGILSEKTAELSSMLPKLQQTTKD